MPHPCANAVFPASLFIKNDIAINDACTLAITVFNLICRLSIASFSPLPEDPAPFLIVCENNDYDDDDGEDDGLPAYSHNDKIPPDVDTYHQLFNPAISIFIRHRHHPLLVSFQASPSSPYS